MLFYLGWRVRLAALLNDAQPLKCPERSRSACYVTVQSQDDLEGSVQVGLLLSNAICQYDGLGQLRDVRLAAQFSTKLLC